MVRYSRSSVNVMNMESGSLIPRNERWRTMTNSTRIGPPGTKNYIVPCSWSIRISSPHCNDCYMLHKYCYTHIPLLNWIFVTGSPRLFLRLRNSTSKSLQGTSTNCGNNAIDPERPTYRTNADITRHIYMYHIFTCIHGQFTHTAAGVQIQSLDGIH